MSITFGGSQAPQSRQLRVLRHSNGRLVFEDFIEVRQEPDLPDEEPTPAEDADGDPDGGAEGEG